MGPPHYPRVVAEFPGNISLTFIERPWNSQKKCAQENETVSTKLRGECPACRIEASCPTKLEAAESRALHGQAINLPVVYAEAEIILVKAEAKQAISICNNMAEQITKQKIQHARCIAPANAH